MRIVRRETQNTVRARFLGLFGHLGGQREIEADPRQHFRLSADFVDRRLDDLKVLRGRQRVHLARATCRNDRAQRKLQHLGDVLAVALDVER